MRFNPNWNDSTVEDYKFKWVEARWTNGMAAWLQNVRVSGTTIVCGHWHCNWGHAYIHQTCSEWGEDAIFEPFIDEGIIAIDACTAHSGKVNVMVIEEEK